ncbi:MAG: polysaccharide biosynthesis/export family protein [Bacteroidota bacterium]
MKRFAQLYFLIILVALGGCTSYPALLNFNEGPPIPSKPQDIRNFKPIKIQSSDILKIQVSSTDPIAAQPFNPVNTAAGASPEGSLLNDYLVDSEGFIIFPTVGKILMAGLTIEEAKQRLMKQLEPYFAQQPIVRVRLTNFKVAINGEVRSPGSYFVRNDRLTIVEALTLAGDFTPYSRRDSILIIRESEGLRSFGYVDFNTSELFDSPYFYLQQNDVIYVQPEKTKINSVRDPATRFLPWISAIASLTAIIISITR